MYKIYREKVTVFVRELKYIPSLKRGKKLLIVTDFYEVQLKGVDFGDAAMAG